MNFAAGEPFYLYVHQDKEIKHDWKTIIEELFDGKHSATLINCIKGHFQHLRKHNIYLKLLWPNAVSIFLFSEKVITNKRTLSIGNFFEWIKVECFAKNQQNATNTFILAQPNEKYIKSLGGNKALSNFLKLMFHHTFTTASNSVKGKPYFVSEFLNKLRFTAIFNLVYIKEIGLPCMLLPDSTAIQIEFNDFFDSRISKSAQIISLYQCPPNLYLMHLKNFVTFGKAGSGISSDCVILKPKMYTAASKWITKKFIAKELNIKEKSLQYGNSSSDSGSSSQLNFRSMLFREASVLQSLFFLNNANIVKPFTFTEPMSYIGNKSNSNEKHLILYDDKMEDLKLIFTMEFIEGSDLSKANVNLMDATTKFYIVVKLAEAILVLHQNGFVHNDLHKGNIRLERETNNPIILDLGSCEKLTEFNYSKDVKRYVKVLLYLYKNELKMKNVPKVLQPLFHDAITNNFNMKKFKQIEDIIELLNNYQSGIVLERKVLDLKFYIIESEEILTSLFKFMQSMALEENASSDKDMNSTDQVHHPAASSNVVSLQQVQALAKSFKDLNSTDQAHYRAAPSNFLSLPHLQGMQKLVNDQGHHPATSSNIFTLKNLQTMLKMLSEDDILQNPSIEQFETFNSKIVDDFVKMQEECSRKQRDLIEQLPL